METNKKTEYKQILLNMNKEMYEVLKELCDERGITVTKYILRAVSARINLETSKE